MKFDTIIIGGGRSGMAKALELQKQGEKCAVVCKGRSLYGFNPDEFQNAGGMLFMGDSVCGAEIADDKVKCIFTENFGKTPLEAGKYFLATGKFFAGGIVADMDKAYEPIFNLDVKYEADRTKWFSEKFADDQPFMSFGVITSPEGCALKDGKAITNLFPIGEIIAK